MVNSSWEQRRIQEAQRQEAAQENLRREKESLSVHEFDPRSPAGTEELAPSPNAELREDKNVVDANNRFVDSVFDEGNPPGSDEEAEFPPGVNIVGEDELFANQTRDERNTAKRHADTDQVIAELEEQRAKEQLEKFKKHFASGEYINLDTKNDSEDIQYVDERLHNPQGGQSSVDSEGVRAGAVKSGEVYPSVQESIRNKPLRRVDNSKPKGGKRRESNTAELLDAAE